jgi:hypothetical protein
MLDRYEPWHAAAGVMLVLLARLHPRVQALLGARGAAWVIAGGLLPLLDYVVPLVTAADSIEFLMRQRVLHSLSTGLLVLLGAALVAAYTISLRHGLRIAALTASGFLLHLALEAVTEAGIWFGPVAVSSRWDWPAFAEGHLPLVGLLALALAGARAFPARRRWVLGGAWALVLLYGAGGLTQYAIVSGRAKALPGATGDTEVLPGDSWRMSWLAVTRGEQEVHVTALGPWGKAIERPEDVPLWNDQVRLLEMIADPVVGHFYFEVFRHPVVTVEPGAREAMLTMREAAGAVRDGAGPVFTLNWASGGRERTYQVQGFH